MLKNIELWVTVWSGLIEQTVPVFTAKKAILSADDLPVKNGQEGATPETAAATEAATANGADTANGGQTESQSDQTPANDEKSKGEITVRSHFEALFGVWYLILTV